MRPPIQLVPDSLSTDTIECLSQLLEHAKDGKIIGLAFTALYKGRRYIVNTAGECHSHPTDTLSLVLVLLLEVNKLRQELAGKKH